VRNIPFSFKIQYFISSLKIQWLLKSSSVPFHVSLKNWSQKAVPMQHVTNPAICVISGFGCEAAENCPVLDHYAAGSGNFLPTFLDNLSFPSSGFKNQKAILHWILEP
jgi:hypothetical protein